MRGIECGMFKFQRNYSDGLISAKLPDGWRKSHHTLPFLVYEVISVQKKRYTVDRLKHSVWKQAIHSVWSVGWVLPDLIWSERRIFVSNNSQSNFYSTDSRHTIIQSPSIIHRVVLGFNIQYWETRQNPGCDHFYAWWESSMVHSQCAKNGTGIRGDKLGLE